MRTNLLAWFLVFPALVQAQITLLFTLGTGRDDLQQGNDNASYTSSNDGLDARADFRRADVSVGLLDNSSRPPYAEPLVIPAKPFPGGIVGDFFAIRGNTRFFTIGADAQDADSPKFLLVPHLSAAPTHYPYVDFIGQPVTSAISSRQFRATLIFKAVNEGRDAVRFIAALVQLQ